MNSEDIDQMALEKEIEALAKSLGMSPFDSMTAQACDELCDLKKWSKSL